MEPQLAMPFVLGVICHDRVSFQGPEQAAEKLELRLKKCQGTASVVP
jgi:hypothetical protein